MTPLQSGARFALIGDPVEHSLSPVMQAAAFRAKRLDATYVALRVSVSELPSVLDTFLAERWTGFNATTPLKEALIERMMSLTPEAKAAGGVNVVRIDGGSMIGHNTDGAGMLDALADEGVERVHGTRVLILGAGPAARAIGAALADAGAHVECWSRTPERARLIGPPPSGESSVAISALPEAAIVPEAVLAHIAAGALVADVNYSAARSPVPARFGARRADGLGMLLHQGARSFQWWTDEPAPLAVMREALARAKGRAVRPGAESKPR